MRAVQRAGGCLAGIVLVAGTSACGGGGGGATSTRVVVKEALVAKGFISGARTESEFKNVWGFDPSTGELNRVRTVTTRAADEGITVLGPLADRTAATQFRDLYSSSDADVVALVGHNDGGSFRFADGSAVDLASLGGQGRPKLALISCESLRYTDGTVAGIPDPITIQAAALAQSKFLAHVAALSSPLDDSQVQVLLKQSVSEASTELRVDLYYRIGVGGTAVAGVSGITIWRVTQQ